MDVSPLWIAIHAIRKCWKSERESDSHFDRGDTHYGIGVYALAQKTKAPFVLGERDLSLLRKVIKHGHESTLEHLKYTFEIKDISRACLQELARHRIASLSVESSRYTLNRLLKNASDELLCAMLVSSGDDDLDRLNIEHMLRVAELGKAKGLTNDVLKYGLVEAWKTELDWTVNARSLRNFIRLRSSKRALKEIRALAQAIYQAIPEDHLPIFSGTCAQITEEAA
jgi:thymidylate synthase (FAD)